MSDGPVIPLLDQRSARLPLPQAQPTERSPQPADRFQRPLRDLRISVTDRCNFRCGYCMPRALFEGHQFLPHEELLSFEEITRAASIFVHLGVTKLRLTGGEPLMRKQLDRLVRQLSTLRTPDGEVPELTMTTNGSLLRRHAQALWAAGLKRLTVSLDALDDGIFKRMNDANFPVADVLDGIAAAQAAGFTGIKVNMVVQRGVNDAQVLPMATYFRGTGVELRFIEYMDVGSTNAWRMEQVLPSDEVVRIINERWTLEPLPVAREGETARRWRYADGGGCIGTISSVTQAFCAGCNRARLSTDGQIYLCLFATQGHDLRAALRGTATDEQVAAQVATLWGRRGDRYSELRAELRAAADSGQRDPGKWPRVEMSFIGG